MITITFNENENLYEQIYQSLKQAIIDGYYKPDEKLPSYRILANHLDVSINTIKLAYQQLIDEGYIISKERKGFFVDKIQPPKLNSSQINISINSNTHELENDYQYQYDFNPNHVDLSKLPMNGLKQAAQEGMKLSQKVTIPISTGELVLKEEIVKFLYQYRGVTTTTDHIVITSGFEQSIYILNKLLDEPIFGVEDPGFPFKNIESFIKPEKIFHIPIDQYGFSVEKLEQTKANICITTPNHQFPSGIIMGLRRRQRLLNWAKEDNKRFIIEDDYDSLYKYSGKPIPTLKSHDTNDQVILLGSFSKLIGKFLKISYMVIPDALLQKFSEQKIIDFTPSLYSQYTLYNFMNNGKFYNHINRMNNYYRKKQKMILNYLKQYKGIEIISQNAGLYLVIKLNPNLWNLKQIKQNIITNQIDMKSVSNYHTKNLYNNLYLIGFGGIKEEEIEEGLQKFLNVELD